ncbi:Ig-like domain-containing protein [Rahnella victoriana]|uniref:Ig-like domain-containing protein n=1 Tax=Rahnella victoriana TaxID=1510570 RepID=UPI001E4407D6|nr:Ig-like domain-containing protein [Rahnella victoriana]UHM89485.1 Ig-like domain-containing protein [Rahnella victoriana]
MAQNGSVVTDVLSRTNGAVISQVSNSSQDVTLNQISIVRVHATRDAVTSYERVGNDLVIHMKDGRTVRYHSFFDTDGKGHHSELIFDDGVHPIEHAAFVDTGATAAAVPIVPAYETIPGVGALVIDSSNFDPAVLGAVLGVIALGAGIAIAAGGGGGGGGSSSDNGGNNGGNEGGDTPTLTLGAFAGDNRLNATEVRSTQTFSGVATNVAAGDTITLTINGKTYTTKIGSGGAWNLPLTAGELQGLADGTYVVTVKVTNSAGASISKSVTVVVDTTPPVINVNAVSGDNIINAAEHNQPLVVSGTASASEAGRTITVTLNGVNYTATVGSNGAWSVTVPANRVAALANGEYDIRVALTDSAGNSTTVTHDLTVNTSVVSTTPTITLNAFAGDNVLDGAERQVNQTISGSTTHVTAGQVVTITLNGKTYTATVLANGKWSVSVPAADLLGLENGTLTINATVKDTAGHTATTNENVTVNASLAGIVVNPISGDGQLNQTEAQSPLAISGIASNVPAGTVVTVTLNGKTYTGTTTANGSWSINVPAADLQALADGATTVKVSMAGVSVNASVNVATHPGDVTLTPPFGGDGVLNNTEAGSNQTLTGNTGLKGAGQTVSVVIDGHTYTGTVLPNGTYTVTLPASAVSTLPQGQNSVVVNVTDSAGNHNSLTTNVSVDTVAPTLVINPLAGDGQISLAEAAGALTLSGTASVADAGKTVTITIDGNTFTAVVGDNGAWSTQIPAGTLTGLNGDFTVSATLTDAAGNSTTSTSPLHVVADATVQPVITVNAFGGDNAVDGAEVQTAQVLTGTTTRVEAGQIVTITLNGNTYEATVQASGNWSVIIPAADMVALTDGTKTINVSVSDKAGNPATGNDTFTVDSTDNGIAIDPVTGDNVINVTETNDGILITGTTLGVAPFALVTVTFGSLIRLALVQPNGKWSLALSSADLQSLGTDPAGLQLSASVQALDGTTLNNSVSVGVDNVAPVPTLNTPFTDGLLNATEAAAGQTLSGTTGKTGDGQTVTVTLGGHTYNATVAADGSWTVKVPAADLQALPAGNVPITVNATDGAGNTASVSGNASADFTAPTLTVNPVSGDGYINGAEAADGVAITGTASISEQGRTVTVTLNGETYTGIVQPNGQWSVSVPAATFNGVADGSYPVKVQLSDAAGNSTTVNSSVQVAADAANSPTISVNTFAGNNVLDGAEQKTAQQLSGTTSHVEAGQTVLILLNGHSYTAVVQPSGSWSVSVPAADLALLANGTTQISVSVADKAGNVATGSETLTVNNLLSGLSVNPVAGDNQLNAGEAAAGITLSGTSSNVPVNGVVTITLNGKTYTATVGVGGAWSAQIPAADLALLNDGNNTVKVSATDAAGNPVSGSSDFGVIIHSVPAATLNTPFGDTQLNASEAAAGQTLTGSTGVSGDGQTVTVTIGGNGYPATVDASGNWSATVPAGDLQTLPQGPGAVQVAVTDAAGNTSNISAPVTIDTVAPVVTITTPVAGDGTINAADAGAVIPVSGTAGAGEAGDTVTISIGGHTYTGTVAAGGGWTVNIPADALANVANGTYTLTATVTDAAGNAGTATAPVTVTADPAFLPTIDIDLFAGDGTLDGAERTNPQTVSGTTTNVEAGQLVIVTVGGIEYEATVQASGAWSVSIPAGTLQTLQNGQATIEVSVADKAGNPAVNSEDFTVNSALGGVTINPITGDNKIDATEAGTGFDISGKTANVPEGTDVTVKLGTATYTTQTDADGNWTVNVPSGDVANLADGTSHVIVTTVTTDQGEVTTTQDLGIYTTLPQPTLNTPFGDGLLSSAEAATDQTLTGKTGLTGDGQTVTVTIDGTPYTGTVATDGSWTVTIPAADLQGLGEGTNTITVAVTDAAGNTGTLPGSVDVDFTPPALSLDLVATDNVINAAEAGAPITLSGNSDPADAGQIVTLTFNGQTYTAEVQANGSWSTTIPANTLDGLADGSYPLTAELTDAAGNTTTLPPVSIEVATQNVPVPTIDTPFGDTFLNQREADTDQTLTGTTGVTGAGQSVVVNIGGVDHAATVDAAGIWTVNISAADLQLITEGPQNIVVTATDSAGNAGTANSAITVDYTLPTLSFDPVATDDIINAAETLQPVVISGTSDIPDAGQTVSVVLSFNNVTYTAIVQPDGTWSFTLPSSVVQALADTTYTLSATITDAAGNTTTGNHSFTVDAAAADLPTLTITAVSEDDYINAVEKGADIPITGTSTNLEAGQTVVVSFNGKNYNALVGANGEWTATVPLADLATLSDGPITVTATSADLAGNPASASHNATVIAQPGDLPTLTINAISGDDYINITEHNQGMTVSGTSTHIPVGGTVTVVITGEDYTATYTATVQANGSWSFPMTAAQVQAMPSGNNTFTATADDVAQNVATSTHDVTVDTIPPLLTVTVDTGGDGIINLAEAALGVPVSGTTDPNLTVKVTFNGKDYLTTASDQGVWSLTIPGADVQALTTDGNKTFGVSVTDTSGNIVTGSGNFTLATHSLPTLTVGLIAGDGVLNIAEAAAGFTLNGTSSGLAAGTAVLVTIPGLADPISGVVNALGTGWTAVVAPGLLSGLDNGPIQISVSATDTALNPASSSASLNVALTQPGIPTINTPFVDGVLNAAEAGATQLITGSTGIVGAGQTVTVTIDGTAVTATVGADGVWTATVPSSVLLGLTDATHTISVTATDSAGNPSSEAGTLDFTALTHVLPVAGINIPFGDGVLNLDEATAGGTITGTTGITSPGQTVTVVINGNAVPVDVDSAAGTWTVTLTPAQLLGLQDGTWPVVVTVTDSAGNTSPLTASVDVQIHNVPAPTINLPFGDGTLNIAESTAVGGQTLTGSTGVTGAGQTVSVAIAGMTGSPFTAAVDPVTGNWSLNLTPVQLASLGTPTAAHLITVTATDGVGNHTDATLSFTSHLSAPVPVINEPFLDGSLNIAEAAGVNVITGNTGITGDNQNVKLTIDVGGTIYTATVDPTTGDWAVSLPAGVLNSLGSGTHDINVTVTDAAGNTTPATLPFTSYLTVPDVTIDTPFGDGYLNATEAGVTQTLTGTTGLTGANQTVVVTIGGLTIPGVTVDANGNWSAPLTAGELADLPQGPQEITVTVTDGGGNTGSAMADVGIAVTLLPTVAVTSFAGAGFDLTYTESQSTQTITGTTVNVQAGQQVTVSVGGISHQATVLGDGSWSVTLTPAELGTLTTGQTIGVTVSDLAGNPATGASAPITVNLTPPAFSISIDPVTGDNIINVADGSPLNITVSGKTLNVPDNTEVIVTVGSVAHTATVTGGVWSVSVAATEFTNGTTTTVTASTLDPLTNATQGVLVDTTLPTVTINAFTGDDVLNSTESKSAQLITGTADAGDVGRVVVVNLNGKTYSGTVQAGGTWSVSVPAADLQALPQGSGATNVISATLTDAAGNVGTAVPHTVNVDTAAPLLALDVVAGNNVINLVESLANVLVGGTSSGADGQTVNVTLGGASIGTAVIQPGGAWTLNLTPAQLLLLNDGTLTLAATVTDQAGNTTSVSTGLDIFFNKLLALNVTSGLGLTDGFLNLAESQVAQTISGTAIGAGVGSVVSTVINGTPLSAIVGANGAWSLNIPAALLGALGEGQQVLNINLTDAAGNVKASVLNLDVIKTLPVLGDLDPLFGGNGLLNAAESLLAQTIGGVATAVDGTLVTVTLGGKTYNTTVTAGTWDLQIQPGDLGALLDGNLNLGITLTDPAGNTSTTTVPVGIAIHNLPQVVLNTVFGDGVLNIADLLVNQTISGTVSNVAAGTAIAVQVGTQTINGVVDATGHFLVTVPPSVLGLLSGTTAAVSVTVADAAGNVGSAVANAVLDLVKPVINLTSVLGDGLLNAADALTTQVIGGTVSGVTTGTQVQVTLGGKTFLGATDASGAFSITLQPGDLKALGDGTFTVGVSVTDSGGNTSTTSGTLNSIINAVPKIVLDPVFGADGILNAAEALLTQTISGTVTNGHVGETVNINIGGGLINLTAAVGSDGKFTASLTPLQLAGLLDGNLTIVTSVTDAVGNTASNTVGLNVGIHNLPSIVLNPLFGDGVLNVVDLLTGQTISGVATNVAQGTQVQVSLNGKNYLATVGAGGIFSVTVPALDLSAILNGTQSVVASLTDGSGNPASVTGLLNVVSQSLPTITLNPLFGDGLLNAADALLTQTISGTTTNAQGSTVTLNVGGNTLTALVKADGTFSVAVPQLTLSGLLDGTLNVGASVTNAAGHAVSGNATATVGIHTLPTLLVNTLFGGDQYLNAAEAGVNTNITGTSNLLNGTVSVSIGGVTHTGTITNGAWSVPFTSAELKGLADGSTQVSVSVADLVGNTAIISNPLSVLTHALPLVALNPLLGLTLGVVGGILGGQGLTLSGTSRNIAQGGQVSVTLLGNTLAGTVQGDGSWTVKLSSALLSSYGLVGLLNALLGAIVELKAVDAAGNGFDAHVGLTVGSSLPPETATLMATSLSAEDSNTHTLAAASLTSEASTTSTTESSDTTHATSTLVSSLATTESGTTTTADTTSHADTAFSIGGVTLDLTATDGVAVGGSGDDVIAVHTLDFGLIDGGTGVDTLLLAGTNQHLDLTVLGLKVEHIDIFDLGNSGTNSISLNLHEALSVKDNPTDEVIIKGGEGSLVNLQMGTDGAWSETGQRTVDGLTFDVYHNASMDASNTLGDVLVQHGLHVQQS